ncbi:E3 SUMO-protein ligase ZBED1 isoform X1 [Schistocerca nitens]|uniref:E3 SUMO-protein ligase ZBED1 isoform X1 n=1 Tax=Schistocerca nitens TaxID=7011 RepID=UPI002117CB99|nr:E3 SUMO-protein ligase ZBED1 isoform X1 [Schistocerca nitens]
MDSKIQMQMMLAKMMEEKHTFTYKKLVVPMSMRSIYWKYFGFPATNEGDILTKVKIVCILCKTQITYNRNTSNLRMHLQNKHAHELLELEASAPPRRPSMDPKEKRAMKKLKLPGLSPHIYTTAADGTVQIEGDIQFITDPNITLQNIDDDSSSNQNVRVVLKGNTQGMSNQNVAIILPEENNSSSHIHSMVDGKTVSDAIAEFIILDLQLPDVVEGRGFQRLIATLRSPCEIPSKTKLEEEIIPKIYDSFKDSAMSALSGINSEMSMSIEEWSLASGELYITVSVHYQPSVEPVMETKVLCSIHCAADMDSSQWSITFDALFQEWDLKIDHITAVVIATTREEILTALSHKGLSLVPCLVHSLQLCTTSCFEQPEVAAVLNKCRAIIASINRNANAAATLRIQEQMMQHSVFQIEEGVLAADYPKVWTSTYLMLEQMLVRRNILPSVLENVEIADKEAFILNDHEWKMLEDLVMILEPFKVTIMTLSEEKIPLISLLKPLLWQLNSSHLKVKDTDTEFAQSFKATLSESLSARYSDPAVDVLLQTATTLDPRFKLLPYATEEDKSIISGPMKQMLISYVEEERGCPNGEESPSKKSRLSGMEFLLGDLCTGQSGMPAEERANLELVQYQSESAAALDQCPLTWWARAAAKCPNLARLARKYNCVPASSVPPGRIPVENQVLFHKRRANLSPELVDKLLFLNGNHVV